MIVHDFDVNNLNDLVKNGVVLIDFYADWCGPCKMLSPELETIANENKNITIYKINVDNNPDIARKYGVMSIPTLVLYKDGNLEKKTMGFMPSDAILEWINE